MERGLPPLRLTTFSLPLAARVEPGDAAGRLRAMMGEHLDPLWRFLRRLGVREPDVDDAMQEITFIAARRNADIEVGKEKSFLFSTAFRVASEFRRRESRRREVGVDEAAETEDPAPSADELSDQARARAALDRVLSGMPLELRAVFVLYELDEHTMSEIAGLLGLAPGTVASRLRRARAHFEAEVTTLKRRLGGQGAS